MLKKRDRQTERAREKSHNCCKTRIQQYSYQNDCMRSAHTTHTRFHDVDDHGFCRSMHTQTHTRRVYYYTFTPLWPFRLVCPDDIGLFNEYRLLTHWSNTKRKRAPAYVGDAINYWNVDKSECLCRVASFCIWLTKEMVSCARTQFNICIYRIRMLLLWSFLNDRSAISNWWIFDMKTYPTHRLHGMDVANHLITLGLFT